MKHDKHEGKSHKTEDGRDGMRNEHADGIGHKMPEEHHAEVMRKMRDGECSHGHHPDGEHERY